MLSVLHVNPFNPKFKKYILPTFWREMYKWGSEKLITLGSERLKSDQYSKWSAATDQSTVL